MVERNITSEIPVIIKEERATGITDWITYQRFRIRCSKLQQILAMESMQKKPQIFLQNEIP